MHVLRCAGAVGSGAGTDMVGVPHAVGTGFDDECDLGSGIIPNSGNNESHDISGGFSTTGLSSVNLLLWGALGDVLVDTFFAPGGLYVEDIYS